MTALQPGVLAPIPPVVRYRTFALKPQAKPRRVFASFTELADGEGCVMGLGDSLDDAFEAQLRRMVGAEDGVPEALFKFTLPVTGAYFCPPVRRGHIDITSV